MDTYRSRYTERARLRISYISVGSAAKVMAVLSALVWAVLGAILVFFALCGITFLGGAATDNELVQRLLTEGVVTTLTIYVMGIIFNLIFGAILGAIYAGLYNVTASWTGGLELDVGT